MERLVLPIFSNNKIIVENIPYFTYLARLSSFKRRNETFTSGQYCIQIGFHVTAKFNLLSLRFFFFRKESHLAGKHVRRPFKFSKRFFQDKSESSTIRQIENFPKKVAQCQKTVHLFHNY